MTAGKPRIVLGVTVDLSLRLMAGFPQFLAERGWDVHVVSSPGARLDALAEVDGVTVHALTMAREPSPLSDLRSLIAWTRLLRRLRPDVVSVGTPKAGLLGGIAARLTRVPGRVYMLRGLRLETSTGVSRRVFTLLERLAVRSANVVLAVSQSLAARAVELGVTPASKVRVLGLGSSNGVDVAALDRANFDDAALDALAERHGIDRRIPTIGFVGRLTADKGLDLLSEALSDLVAKGIPHQLLVVGGSEDDTGDRRDWQSKTVLTGHVDDPEPYFHLIDVLCLPTKREGFPNVVLEAAAASRPTVTTDATGAVDSVVDGVTGFVVPRTSSSALAEALATLLADRDVRERMGQAARARVVAEFSNHIVWERHEAFYRSQLTSRRRRG
ncbi:glycosyltransferase family 4 protein [Leifsonia sp. Le1]|uniref:glycosyltransferase family 4 protein n=1 Tax=Leifsonia sp. Le1 TaxID=3404918 RepID=UPI003EB79414